MHLQEHSGLAISLQVYDVADNAVLACNTLIKYSCTSTSTCTCRGILIWPHACSGTTRIRVAYKMYL